MNLDFLCQSPALMLVLIPSVIGLLKYAMGIWAIRTARTPAEQKAQAEVARLAVASAPVRDVLAKIRNRSFKNDGSG